MSRSSYWSSFCFRSMFWINVLGDGGHSCFLETLGTNLIFLQYKEALLVTLGRTHTHQTPKHGFSISWYEHTQLTAGSGTTLARIWPTWEMCQDWMRTHFIRATSSPSSSPPPSLFPIIHTHTHILPGSVCLSCCKAGPSSGPAKGLAVQWAWWGPSAWHGLGVTAHILYMTCINLDTGHTPETPCWSMYRNLAACLNAFSKSWLARYRSHSSTSNDTEARLFGFDLWHFPQLLLDLFIV